MRTSFSLVILATAIVAGSAQECPTDWTLKNGMCYYFSKDFDIKTWVQAESFCQTSNGHLVSFLTQDEEDWITKRLQLGTRPSRYWLGLSDRDSEGDWRWSDGNSLDPALANWKLNEPNNANREDCAELWIEPRVIDPEDGKWNDNNCENTNSYICKRPTGSVSQCPDGWSLQSNSRCYRVFSGTSTQWFDAYDECKNRGADLVSIGSSTEESIVELLVKSYNAKFWIGYSDTASPGTFAWSDKVTQPKAYTNWAAGEPPSTLEYFGSSCVQMNNELNNKWDVIKCSDERPFVCERGLRAQCPYGWLYGEGKCYEFVANPSRKATWIDASYLCQAAGAGLLKIETEEQQSFISSSFKAYWDEGQREIWFGVSDIGHDEDMRWWDKTPITKSFWDVDMPATVPNRDDCGNLYTGRGGSNWEVTGCFLELGYICELPEGKELAQVPPVTVEGKCEDGWRHFQKKCYLFSQEELSQTAARSKCQQKNGDLTSIADEYEQSFLVGHLTSLSWIGWKVSANGWTDGSPNDFTNWIANEPSGGDCVVSDIVGGYWDAVACTDMHPYVCKKDEIPTTPSTIAPPTYVPDLEKCGGNGWVSDPDSANCYKVNTLRRTWVDALQQCQADGGNLASINSPNEQLFVENMANLVISESHLWLGGNDRHGSILTDQGWRWSDGSPFNYVHWASGEPNNANDEDCMQIYVDSGLWNDIDCGSYLAFVCEKVGNVDNAVPGDVSDGNCGSTDSCCFKHIGCEYKGAIPDSAFSASTEKDKWFVATRGRLNTPADVVILSTSPEVYVGTGHGAWEPEDGDSNPWLQVDLPTHYELKGIITQGRNGLLKHEEMQWTTTYKVSYTQDVSKDSVWEFISDSDGNTVIFDGNFDQNTMVTNFFPRPIIAKHIRCHPMDYRDRRALRLEYIGCKASCLHKIGMNSGYIADSWISASSAKSGHEAKQARPPVDNTQCLSSSSDNGASYRGWIAKTKSGIRCQPWNSQTPHPHETTYQNYPEAGLVGDYCRNPDNRAGGPWCYTVEPTVESESCDIPVCPNYTPTGWQPSSSSTNEYVQVNFDTHYKISGITLYKAASTSSYVKTYTLSFSEDGNRWNQYINADSSARMFIGLDDVESSYMDVLVEPIATKYLRIQPQTWQGSSILQFEINGCYVDGIITCSELGSNFLTEDTYTVQCPPGCLRDAIIDPVYGTDVYTTNSAVCPSAIHAGKANDNLGGTIFVTNTVGQSSYAGSYRNGITSEEHGAYTSSFTFTGYSLRCDDGWYSWNEHCYWYSPKGDVKTWQAARSSCVALGGDLVSIASEGENDFVKSLLIKMENAGDDAWLGMSDLETSNYYLWVDGTPVTFTKWFYGEPNTPSEHCVQMYIFDGYWNDRECDEPEAYMCKKPKQFLPPMTTIQPPVDEGCDPGWTGYGSSCYFVSDDEFIQMYADIHCEDRGGRLVSIHDGYEQSFVHALVTSKLPAFSGYTAWIGITGHSDEKGGQYFSWQRSEEPVTYTHWDAGEPDALLECTFPFTYRGVSYYECTTVDNVLVPDGVAWCSIDTQYQARVLYCGTGRAQACTHMDDQTGYWDTGLCTFIRYYVCEKDRVGYTQPLQTTPSTDRQCASGWVGNENTAACYQLNEKDDRADRATWEDARKFCLEQKADLVSIHSQEEQQAIIDLIVANGGGTSYTSFWLGLNNIDKENGYVWSDGTAVSYTNWGGGEPNDHNGEESCVESYLTNSASTWNDLNCDAYRNWICKINKLRDPGTPPTIPPPEGHETTECGDDTNWILYTPPDSVPQCYHFEVERGHGFGNAENECQKLGGHLASIHSVEEKSFIFSRIVESGKDYFWIGLRDVAERQFQWSDSTPLDYVNWGIGEPNDYLESEGCIEMNVWDGLWNDDNCGLQQAYVCKKFKDGVGRTIPPTSIPEGNCPAGWSRYGNKCFMIGGVQSNERLSWYDANERCGNMSATLASINNEYEQAYVSSLMYYIGRNAWIGMWGSPWAPFVWLDQSPIVYTNWGAGQPDHSNKACVRVNYASDTVGKWYDDDCEGKNAFICYQRVSTANPEPEPTIPPEDCPTGYTKYATACFKIMTTPMSWDAASDACTNEGDGIYLASINQAYENNMLKSKFWRELTADMVWIGMSFTTTTSTPMTPIDSSSPAPILTETTFAWSDGWPVEYTNWGVGQPSTDETSASKGCVYFNKDGGWSAVSSCSNSMPFVCKKSLIPIPTPPPTPAPLEGDCDPGYVAFGSYCYYIEPGIYTVETRSFWEARGECEARGAQLASFHSESECIAIVDMIEGSSHNLWIGLTHDGYSGWRWLDESPVDFFNWVPGEPNGVDRGEVCVELYPWDGQWNDVDCFEGRGFICRMHKQYAYCGKVVIEERQDRECGFTGIDESQCVRRGCCWDELIVNANFSGCYMPYDGPDPNNPEPVGGGSGLSGGAIAGIVIAVLAVFAIVGVGIYMHRSGKSVSMSDFMYGGSSKTSPPNTVFTKENSGFDNPVTGLDASQA